MGIVCHGQWQDRYVRSLLIVSAGVLSRLSIKKLAL